MFPCSPFLYYFHTYTNGILGHIKVRYAEYHMYLIYTRNVGRANLLHTPHILKKYLNVVRYSKHEIQKLTQKSGHKLRTSTLMVLYKYKIQVVCLVFTVIETLLTIQNGHWDVQGRHICHPTLWPGYHATGWWSIAWQRFCYSNAYGSF